MELANVPLRRPKLAKGPGLVRAQDQPVQVRLHARLERCQLLERKCRRLERQLPLPVKKGRFLIVCWPSVS